MSGAALQIHHSPSQGPASFEVSFPSGRTKSTPVVLRSPSRFPVEGRPLSDLQQELSWYLDKFLDYPYPPETDRAAHVLTSLENWSRETLATLLTAEGSRELFDLAMAEANGPFVLEVSSDDPSVLAWPWEALQQAGSDVGRNFRIERRIEGLDEKCPSVSSLPKDRINVLLVVARPYYDDVPFRSISRPLVELAQDQRSRAAIDVLRPPTLEALCRRLQEKPDFYHILHFDGHGAYVDAHQAIPSSHTMSGNQGCLVFENDEGIPDAISASELGVLLRNCTIPLVILNACHSATSDGERGDPFSSVAASISKAGAKNVVAMSHALYVSGAQLFLPAFYKALLEGESIAAAVSAGREQMHASPERLCSVGRFPLRDWVVPALYARGENRLHFSFDKSADASKSKLRIPEEARLVDPQRDFVGRDAAILYLERALRQLQPAVLIYGLSGIGKTTLVRGMLEWLDATGGIRDGCFWFDLRKIHSVEFMLNRMGESVFGPQFSAGATANRRLILTNELREKQCLIVWDNFEAANTNLTNDDRASLLAFLDGLKGGRTKVLITSKSAEHWLGSERASTLLLGGLKGDDLWRYVESILEREGLSIDRQDPEFAKLMVLLQGHPLVTRATLSRLKSHTAARVLHELRTEGLVKDSLDPLASVLRNFRRDVDSQLAQFLVPLSMHQDFVNSDGLEEMAKTAGLESVRPEIDKLMHLMATAGLLAQVAPSVFQIHPIVSGGLRSAEQAESRQPSANTWARAFVTLMAVVAENLRNLDFHKQKVAFRLNGENFLTALVEARRLEMIQQRTSLLESLGLYHLDAGELNFAHTHFEELIQLGESSDNEMLLAVGHNQLGRIALERREISVAEEHYTKALQTDQRLGDEYRVASNEHQLGMVAQMRHDYAQAESRYRKALEISRRRRNVERIGSACHQLGTIAQEQRDFGTAQKWYQEGLDATTIPGDTIHRANTYHQMAVIAQELRDFGSATDLLRKEFEIREKLGGTDQNAHVFHQMGIVAQLQRDFNEARRHLHKAALMWEQQGDSYRAAMEYHQLAMVAREERDFSAARAWLQKELEIVERLGDEAGKGALFHELGTLAHAQDDLTGAEDWYKKSIEIKEMLGDEHGTAVTFMNLGNVASQLANYVESERHYEKAIRIYEKYGDEHGAAQTYFNLGLSKMRRPESDLTGAEALFSKALARGKKVNDAVGQAHALRQLGILTGRRGDFVGAGRNLVEAIKGFHRANDPWHVATSAGDFAHTFKRADPAEKIRLQEIWQAAGLGVFPPPGTALSRIANASS